jgi:hypothetical protein
MRDYVRAYDALSITVTLDQSLLLGRGPLHAYLCDFICLSVSVFVLCSSASLSDVQILVLAFAYAHACMHLYLCID